MKKMAVLLVVVAALFVLGCNRAKEIIADPQAVEAGDRGLTRYDNYGKGRIVVVMNSEGVKLNAPITGEYLPSYIDRTAEALDDCQLGDVVISVVGVAEDRVLVRSEEVSYLMYDFGCPKGTLFFLDLEEYWQARKNTLEREEHREEDRRRKEEKLAKRKADFALAQKMLTGSTD